MKEPISKRLQKTKKFLKAYTKKHKYEIIGTIVLFLVGIIAALIPFFVNQLEKHSIESEITNLFQKYQIETYDEAISLLERKGYTNDMLYSDENETILVWNTAKQQVFRVVQRNVSISKSLSSFDYDLNYTIGYYYGSEESYVLARPQCLKNDMERIFHASQSPKEKITFESQGFFREFIEYVYDRTLISKQQDGVIYNYLGGKGAISTDFDQVQIAILSGIDTNSLLFPEISLSSLHDGIQNAKEIVIEPNVRHLNASTFHGNHATRFIAKSNQYRLESDVLIENATNTAIAFPTASSQKEVILSNQIQSIEEGAFYGSSIEKLTLPFVGLERGATFPSIGLFGTIFGKGTNGCNQLVGNSYITYAIPTTLHSVTITDETILCTGAFSGCSYLQTIQLNEGITNIQNYAFDRCTSLETLSIPASVLEMTMTKDNGLSSLKRMELPQGLDLEYTELFTKKELSNDRVIYSK